MGGCEVSLIFCQSSERNIYGPVFRHHYRGRRPGRAHRRRLRPPGRKVRSAAGAGELRRADRLLPQGGKLSGAELAERLYSQAEALGTRIELEEALEIQSGTPSRVVTDYGAYTAGAVILAAGMRRRTLGLAGEDRLAGISFCAVCDGAFYAGQDVAVAGGGSTALQDALYLADICRHVTVIHRRSDFRADPILVERAEKTANLTLLRSTVVEALEGSERLTGLTLRNTAVGEVSHLPVSALFQAVGLLPESRLARSLGVPVDEAGFIAAGEDCLTPIPGIFAAGDLRAKEVRQLTTACADGAVAALAACRFCV